MIPDLNETEKYKQLPLDGNPNDYYRTEELLNGVLDIKLAIEEFYKKNKNFNPRQLHYLVSNYSLDTQLDILLGL